MYLLPQLQTTIVAARGESIHLPSLKKVFAMVVVKDGKRRHKAGACYAARVAAGTVVVVSGATTGVTGVFCSVMGVCLAGKWRTTFPYTIPRIVLKS